MAAMEHFKVDHAATEWTWQTKKCSFDKVAGSCAAGLASRFCAGWGLQAGFCNHVTYYDQNDAETPSIAWRHHMSYFLELWKESGEDPGFVFTGDHIND